MAGVNKVILVGNLGRDPEIRYTQDGRPIANFSIATSETWKDKNTGERKEKTEWHRIVVFGNLAEICGKYLSKGKPVYIEGKLQTRSWDDQSGVEKVATEVVVDARGTMQMLGNQSQRQSSQSGSNYTAQSNNSGGGYSVGDETDVPF